MTGADLVPLLAGLGVGGLAVALAARETITDVFGALMILADRPYCIGHRVVSGDDEGTLQGIACSTSSSKVPDWSTELFERQRIFLEVIRLAHALGVQFAFPTQTLEIEAFRGQPGREPMPDASAEELRTIAESYASTAGAGRPRGLGIFVPPHKDGKTRR